MKASRLLTALTAGLFLMAACGEGRPPGVAGNDSTLVGGPCMNNSECDAGLCQMGTSFPGGVCTISCGSSGQCPSNSWCAELDAGWICLVSCAADEECREQWSCQSVTEAGTNGTSTKNVCLGSAPAS